METEIKIIANLSEEQLECLLSEIKNTSEIMGVKLKVQSNKIIQNGTNEKLPEFLYERDGNIKVAYFRDSDVTEEWAKWKSVNLI
jgi:hypothetical protein